MVPPVGSVWRGWRHEGEHELLNGALGLEALGAACFGDGLEARRPFAFGLGQERFKQGWLKASDMREALGVSFAGEAVVEEVWREPVVEIRQEALKDEIGSAHGVTG